MILTGKVDLKPLISESFPFDRSNEAFERAAEGRPGDVKLQIELGWAMQIKAGDLSR